MQYVMTSVDGAGVLLWQRVLSGFEWICPDLWDQHVHAQDRLGYGQPGFLVPVQVNVLFMPSPVDKKMDLLKKQQFGHMLPIQVNFFVMSSLGDEKFYLITNNSASSYQFM